MLIIKNKKIDKKLLIITGLLIAFGFIVFMSASLGLLARSGTTDFQSIAFTQIVLGICFGTLLMGILSKINYRIWKRLAVPIFIISLLLTFLVFVPGLGYSSGGAMRWLYIEGISFQPGELLKVATIIFTAYYLSSIYKRLRGGFRGLAMIITIIVVSSTPLLLQPDTGTVVVIAITIMVMFFTAGARWRDISILIVIGLLSVAVLAFTRPYILDRLMTFMHPWDAQQTTGYQIKQSLLGVGSGGVFGRGLGQSVQKFNYLPKPTSDSIFAIIGEEFGLVGASFVVLMFLLFAQRSFRIASCAPDQFGVLVVIGLSFLIVSQAILNISAMLGLAPLSGLPLPFISHGGTAMAVMLASVGIILAVSRLAKI